MSCSCECNSLNIWLNFPGLSYHNSIRFFPIFPYVYQFAPGFLFAYYLSLSPGLGLKQNSLTKRLNTPHRVFFFKVRIYLDLKSSENYSEYKYIIKHIAIVSINKNNTIHNSTYLITFSSSFQSTLLSGFFCYSFALKYSFSKFEVILKCFFLYSSKS